MVFVRPSDSRLSMRKCWSAKAAICGRCVTHKNLLAAAEGFELLPDGLRRAAADADVDLVENQGARGGRFLLRLGRALFHADFEGQHDAGHLAAGGDLVRAA